MDFLEILAFLPQPSGCEGQAAAYFPRIFLLFPCFGCFLGRLALWQMGKYGKI